MQWMRDTPIEVLQGLAGRIPVLQAEEALRQVQVVLATNNRALRDHDSREVIRGFRRYIDRDQLTRGSRRVAGAQQLAGMGIGVRKVELPAKPEGGDA